MKACRFILNTDYVTSQNDREFEITVALPSTFTVAADVEKHFKTSIAVPGTASMNYRCYFTTSTHQYATTGCVVCMLKYGNDQLTAAVTHTKDTFTLDIYNFAPASSHTYTGAGRTVTAHIQTFVDPFQL